MEETKINYTPEQQEEILNALRVISNVCKQYGACQRCPLYSEREGECAFETNAPAAIPINEPNPMWYAVR